MHKKNTQGLTLIELIVTVAIFAVLASLAVPNLQSFMRSNRLTATTNDMATSLNLSRSEAVKRGTAIKTCISNAAQSNCNTGTTNWENGWLTFIDADDDDSVDSGEKVLRISESVGGGTTIRSTQFASTITYNADGTAGSLGSFKICDENANAVRARGINITRTGQISSAKDTQDDGTRDIYTDTAGNLGDITCP